MLDTVKLRSPFLTVEAAAQIEVGLTRLMKWRPDTGELLMDLTSDSLLGSWDSRIQVRLLREEFRQVGHVTDVRRLSTFKRAVGFELVPCEPYLIVEGSVHKALLGHNVFGGPVDFVGPCRWFVEQVARRLGVPLPDGAVWLAERVDWAECYELPYDACQELISCLGLAKFPRRKVSSYGDGETVFAPGTTTAVKLYHKGPEFAVHDSKRLRLFLEPDALEAMQRRANRTLRAEVGIKSKKLMEITGCKPLVSEISPEWLRGVHDREVGRLLKEGSSEMEQVRTAREVNRRLEESYPTASGQLFGLWVKLATLGEREVRQGMARSTFFDQKAKLLKAGCSWAGTDVQLRHTAIPVDFSVSRRDPRRLVLEDVSVVAALAAYRAAA